MPVATKSTNRKNKHFILNQSRLKKAQKILGTRTETETIETALKRVINEEEADRLAAVAHEELFTALIEGGAEIKDVFGRLEDK